MPSIMLVFIQYPNNRYSLALCKCSYSTPTIDTAQHYVSVHTVPQQQVQPSIMLVFIQYPNNRYSLALCQCTYSTPTTDTAQLYVSMLTVPHNNNYVFDKVRSVTYDPSSSMSSKTFWMLSVSFFHTQSSSLRPISACASTGISDTTKGTGERKKTVTTDSLDSIQRQDQTHQLEFNKKKSRRKRQNLKTQVRLSFIVPFCGKFFLCC